MEKVECKSLIFFQVIFVLKSFYKIGKKAIAEMMLKLLDYKGFYIEKKIIMKRTLELWKQHNIEIFDSYLIACLEEKGETEIYSYDAGFDKFTPNRMEP
jgi:predicted nucleic-acid-binding protein